MSQFSSCDIGLLICRMDVGMAMSAALPTEINIVTLNCWGLKFNISKLREARLQEIGRQLAVTQPVPHIVCLQEVWAHDDYLASKNRHLRNRDRHD